ncbi:MAG: TrbG/VirB9 family P-type conjugative transfer protein [Treponema sp.]|jgi:type IV secretion system protein VirB9|nr:TrbG/VirB9 family P-type conjugative transfer protein [Treponema sp.]
MKKIGLLFLCALAAASCASVDVERKVRARRGTEKPAAPSVIAVPIETEAETKIIERPVYVPPRSAQAAPPRGTAAVQQAAREGTAQPQDYSASAMIYDYHRDFVYEIYCRPLRITDIWLRAGERASEPPFVSDSERWMLGAGVSYEAGESLQHIYVKPVRADIEATLIINTNERVYHIILRSYNTLHMPMVRWRYQENTLAQNYIKDEAAVFTDPENGLLADPRFLSFNYRISYGLFKKPRWLPELAYDDGKKTYITFPDETLQAELPAVFENRADAVNYRVTRNVMIIDKLVEKITVKIGGRSVVIQKKRGGSR